MMPSGEASWSHFNSPYHDACYYSVEHQVPPLSLYLLTARPSAMTPSGEASLSHLDGSHHDDCHQSPEHQITAGIALV